MIAQFGNVACLHSPDVPGDRVTTFEFPDGHTVEQAFVDVTDESGAWVAHSAAAPSWVACSNPDLEALFASHYDAPIMPVAGINS